MEYTEPERLALEKVRAFTLAVDREGLARSHDEAFRALGAAFTQGRMTGIEFEREFLALWRLYRDHGVPTSEEIDQLFTDVDTFCGDPELWEEGDLDEDGLRAAVARSLGNSGTAIS